MKISDIDIAKAEQMDLLTYLQIYEPGNLKRVAGNEYRTIDHDSLRISNGKWHWYSKGIGGYNALQYLMKVREIPRCSAADPTAAIGGIPEYDTATAARKETGIFSALPKLQSQPSDRLSGGTRNQPECDLPLH